MKTNKKILMLCSGVLFVFTVACNNEDNEKHSKNQVASSSQNANTNKSESPVEKLGSEENVLPVENKLSQEDQEIVDALFNSVPEIKTYYQKDKEYKVSLTAEVTKPNPNATDKNEKEYYKVKFEGKILGSWVFYVQLDKKEVLFKGIFVGNKGFYTYEEFKKEADEVDEYYEKLKEKVPEFRKNVKTTVAKKLQNKVAKNQEISDEEILEYLDEVAEPEFAAFNQVMAGKGGMDIKKDRKVIKQNPNSKDPLKREFYQVETLRETFYIKPTFEEKDIYFSHKEANSVQVYHFIDFSMEMISQSTGNKK